MLCCTNQIHSPMFCSWCRSHSAHWPLIRLLHSRSQLQHQLQHRTRGNFTRCCVAVVACRAGSRPSPSLKFTITAPSLLIFASAIKYNVNFLWINCVDKDSFFLCESTNIGTFDKYKTLVEACYVIVKLQTSRRFVSGCSSGGVRCVAVVRCPHFITILHQKREFCSGCC